MLYVAHVMPIFPGMTDRQTQRVLRRHHVEWWIVAAWASLALVVVAGLTAATGLVG